MSTFIFLRHGHSSANESGLLTGRLPGVGLSEQGRRQAQELVTRIGRFPIDHIYISPIERCALTIDPWLKSRNSSHLTSLEINDGFSEIDFGSWSGRKLSSLKRLPEWKMVQRTPASFSFPGGDSFRAAQRRAVQSFADIRGSNREKVRLIVSHSDTIKLIVASALGMKLNEFQTLHVAPASFTIFSGDAKKLSLVTINNSGSLLEILT